MHRQAKREIINNPLWIIVGSFAFGVEDAQGWRLASGMVLTGKHPNRMHTYVNGKIVLVNRNGNKKKMGATTITAPLLEKRLS